jgi:hypothetical protein
MDDKLANFSSEELRQQCSELSLMRISSEEIARRINLPRAKIAEYVSIIRNEEAFKKERGLDSKNKDYIMQEVERSELREKLLWKTLPPDILDESIQPHPAIANTLSHIREESTFRRNLLIEFDLLQQQKIGAELQSWETSFMEFLKIPKLEANNADIERVLSGSTGESSEVYGEVSLDQHEGTGDHPVPSEPMPDIAGWNNSETDPREEADPPDNPEGQESWDKYLP